MPMLALKVGWVLDVGPESINLQQALMCNFCCLPNCWRLHLLPASSSFPELRGGHTPLQRWVLIDKARIGLWAQSMLAVGSYSGRTRRSEPSGRATLYLPLEATDVEAGVQRPATSGASSRRFPSGSEHLPFPRILQ
jgi:hypothetical protein